MIVEVLPQMRPAAIPGRRKLNASLLDLDLAHGSAEASAETPVPTGPPVAIAPVQAPSPPTEAAKEATPEPKPESQFPIRIVTLSGPVPKDVQTVGPLGPRGGPYTPAPARKVVMAMETVKEEAPASSAGATATSAYLTSDDAMGADYEREEKESQVSDRPNLAEVDPAASDGPPVPSLAGQGGAKEEEANLAERFAKKINLFGKPEQGMNEEERATFFAGVIRTNKTIWTEPQEGCPLDKPLDELAKRVQEQGAGRGRKPIRTKHTDQVRNFSRGAPRRGKANRGQRGLGSRSRAQPVRAEGP